MWRNVGFEEMPKNSLIFREKEHSNNKMFILIRGKVGISVKVLVPTLEKADKDD